MPFYIATETFIADPPCPGDAVTVPVGTVCTMAHHDIYSCEFITADGKEFTLLRDKHHLLREELTGREMDIECYHNVYKSMHGHRPRHVDFSSMSDDEIQAALKELFKVNEDWAVDCTPF